MAMETRLSLRQSQRVVMTPLLQQAIQLLQLSTLELQEVVQKELLENPLLEELPADGTEPQTATTEPETPPPPVEPPSATTATRDESQTDDLPFDLTSVIFDHQEERSLVQQEERRAVSGQSAATGVEGGAAQVRHRPRTVASRPHRAGDRERTPGPASPRPPHRVGRCC